MLIFVDKDLYRKNRILMDELDEQAKKIRNLEAEVHGLNFGREDGLRYIRALAQDKIRLNKEIIDIRLENEILKEKLKKLMVASEKLVGD